MISFPFVVRGVCFLVLIPHLQKQSLIMNLSSLCTQPSVPRGALVCESNQLFAPAHLQACFLSLSSIIYEQVCIPLRHGAGGNAGQRGGGKWKF